MTTVSKSRIYEGNSEAIEAWNGVLFDKFLRFRDIVCGGLGPIGTEALRRHPPAPGSRVLDVGCGFGDSTQQIAELVGPGGEAVGIDAAARFIELASSEAAQAGASQARFMVADVQLDDLEGPYDHAFSRFGTMFFDSPVAALRNVRSSLRHGSEFTMTVWRKKEDNAWLHDAELAVLDIVPLPPVTDQPTCGPGPFSMAGADLVSTQLLASGFGDVCLERYDTSISIGKTVAAAIECAMALGPAGEIIRLAGEEGVARRPAVVAALEKIFARYSRPDGVFAPASTWIVTARAV